MLIKLAINILLVMMASTTTAAALQTRRLVLVGGGHVGFGLFIKKMVALVLQMLEFFFSFF